MEHKKKKFFNLAVRIKEKDCQEIQSPGEDLQKKPMKNIFLVEKESNRDGHTRDESDCSRARQVKEFIKKMKKVNAKRAYDQKTFSDKSFTLRTIQQKDTNNQGKLINKEELLEGIRRKMSMTPFEQASNQTTISMNRLKTKHRKNMGSLSHKINEQIYKNRYKIEYLQEKGLTSERKHIAPQNWTKILRKSENLNNFLDKKENAMQKINYKGLKLTACSKRNKEIRWVENSKNSRLFYYLDKKDFSQEKKDNLVLPDSVHIKPIR